MRNFTKFAKITHTEYTYSVCVILLVDATT